MPKVNLPPGVPDFESWLKQRQSEQSSRKRERRGAAPWLPDFSAVKGAGFAAHASAALGSKLGMLALFGLLGSGAAGVGVVNRNRLLHEQEAAKKKQFQTQLLRDHILREHEALKKAVPTKDGVRNDTLGFVSQGNLPVSGNADPSAGADAAKAAEDAAAAKAAQEEAAAPEAAPDPNAMAQAMLAQAQTQGVNPAAGAEAAAGRGFGQLSAGLGGMRGGGGMAGGIGRGFDAPKLSNALMGKVQGMKPGADPQGLMDNRARKGVKAKWAANRGVTASARTSKAASKLRQMQTSMAANRNAEVGKSAAANTAAWESIAAPGQAITGAGAAAPIAAAPGGGGAIQPMAAGEGGPMSVGSGSGNDLPTVPEIEAYENVTPYQNLITMAKMIMLAITALSIAILAAKFFGFFGAPLIAALVKVVAGLGAILAILGVVMIGMGQTAQGTLYTVIGAMVAVLAMISPHAVQAGTTATGEATKVLVASKLSLTAGMLGTTAAGAAGFGGDLAMEKGEAGAYDQSEAKNEYKKKWGIDPDTGKVLNESKFDRRYGEGATEAWNENSDLNDMT
ncbi:MAG: hypothetical protein HY554_04815 [Elusimicrobia bacterium]|nr:hypothetical protein [Elusimicrobiota bacterium]